MSQSIPNFIQEYKSPVCKTVQVRFHQRILEGSLNYDGVDNGGIGGYGDSEDYGDM